MARIFSYAIFALLLITQLQLCTSEPLTLIAIGVISGVMGIIDFIWGKVDRIKEVPYGKTGALSVNNIEYQLHLVTAEIIKAVNDANKVQTLKQRIHDAAKHAAQIDVYYRQMKDYNASRDHKTQIMLNESELRLINGVNGPEHYFQELHNLFYSEADENVFQLINDLKQNFTGTCSTGSSLEAVQQIYQKYYTLSAIAAAKTYTILRIASELLGKHYEDVKRKKSNIIQLDNKAIVTLKQYASTASREVWRCDPDKYIEDVTYTKLKRLFQKYIVQEHDLGQHYNTCDGTCSSFSNPTTTNQCSNETLAYVSHSPFHSPSPATTCDSMVKTCEKLWDCEPFPVEMGVFINDYLYICNSEKDSDRRYDYLKRTYGKNGEETANWGRKEDCKGWRTSWITPHLAGVVNTCHVCMCNCDESDADYSESYISLETIYSDWAKNRVVTGIRFVKKYNTIHIEIEEGTLDKRATIVNNSASWVTQEYFKSTPQDASSGFVHKFRWELGREINLQDLHAPEGEIIVGVGLSLHSTMSLYLEIGTMPFDFETGKLSSSPTVTYPDSACSEKLEIKYCDVPTLAPIKSQRIETNKTVTLKTTGMHEDIGQNVIPFWDTQDVTTTIHAPMSGVGIYYKTYGNFGGFLGLKLFTYDMEPHIEVHPENIETVPNEAMY